MRPESSSLNGTQDRYTVGGNKKGNFNNLPMKCCLEINQNYNIFSGNFQLRFALQSYKLIAHFSLRAFKVVRANSHFNACFC